MIQGSASEGTGGEGAKAQEGGVTGRDGGSSELKLRPGKERGCLGQKRQRNQTVKYPRNLVSPRAAGRVKGEEKEARMRKKGCDIGIFIWF